MKVKAFNVPYDPRDLDADNDGVVQEGTIWERPAGSQFLGFEANSRRFNRGAATQFTALADFLDMVGTALSSIGASYRLPVLETLRVDSLTKITGTISSRQV